MKGPVKPWKSILSDNPKKPLVSTPSTPNIDEEKELLPQSQTDEAEEPDEQPPQTEQIKESAKSIDDKKYLTLQH